MSGLDGRAASGSSGVGLYRRLTSGAVPTRLFEYINPKSCSTFWIS